MDEVIPESPGPEQTPDEWMRWRFVDPRAHAGPEGSLARTRYEFARYTAAQIAELAGFGPLIPFRPNYQVSLRTVMFTTEPTPIPPWSNGVGQWGLPSRGIDHSYPELPEAALIVVVGAHEPPNEVEKALPYALRAVGDRDLVFLLPECTQWPTLARLPWIDHYTRVFTYSPKNPSQPDEELQVEEHVQPLRSDVLRSVKTDPAAGSYTLSPAHLGWADEIITWANNHPHLMASHRPTYLAWKVDGRVVLKIGRARGGRLRIGAGVLPGTDSPNAQGIEAVLDGPLVDPEPLREAVRQAIHNRLKGSDSSHLEHRMQAHLQLLPPERRLGLVSLIPECPALRPRPDGPATGSVDFLGVDGEGRIHVVETKVGASEPTVLLQALDYWVWAEANQAKLAASLNANPELQVALDVVIAPGNDGTLLEKHNGYVLDRLSRTVPLTVWRAVNDLHGQLQISKVKPTTLRKNSRFSDRMAARARAAAQLESPAERDQGSTEGVHWEAATAAKEVQAQNKLHPYVGLAHSSQRFALDLFGPLGESGVKKLLTRFFGKMEDVATPTFEWVDVDGLLAESTSGRPHQTQIDVCLQGETVDGRIVALLVEVKLTEPEFGACSHAEMAPPDLQENCKSSGPFGADPSLCWQLRNRDEGQPRKYDQVLTFGPKPDGVEPGCWFLKRNQPMRIAATARGFDSIEWDEHIPEFDECVAVLTAPQGHASIRRRWQESMDMMGSSLMGWLDPEVVLSALSPSAATHVIDRYGIGAPDPLRRDCHSRNARSWDVAAELKLLMWDEVKLIETHPFMIYDCLSLCDYGWQSVFDINRAGSLHYFGGSTGPHDHQMLSTVWSDLAAGQLDEVLDWCRTKPRLAGLNHDQQHEWIRIMPRLAYAYEGRATWQNDLGVGDDWPGKFFGLEDPASQESVEQTQAEQSNDNPFTPYQGYWFLMTPNGQPLVAVNIDAELGWLPSGTRFELATSQRDQFLSGLGL